VRTAIDGISVLGRNTQGVKLINLGEGQRLAGIERIVALNGDAEPGDLDDEDGGEPGVEDGGDSPAPASDD
jgi:DNA gyrase subunit A